MIIWITWEDQRRTNELAYALGVPVYKILYDKHYLLKIFRNSIVTIKLIFQIRPDKVVIQNPSMVLATLMCIMKDLMDYKLIVDRHSNFRFYTANSLSLKEKAFHYLSRYTVKKADLTVVTNSFLEKVIESWRGNGFVLEDKIPTFDLGKQMPLGGEFNVIFPCSFAADEPLEEVIESARLLPDNIKIYITGDYKKVNANIISNSPSNIVYTGFIEEQEYQSLIYSCDLVLALTKRDHTLLCCAYEGVSVSKPLILSKWECLEEYFYKGVKITENNPEDISRSIMALIKDYNVLQKEVTDLSDELKKQWQVKCNDLMAKIEKL